MTGGDNSHLINQNVWFPNSTPISKYGPNSSDKFVNYLARKMDFLVLNPASQFGRNAVSWNDRLCSGLLP